MENWNLLESKGLQKIRHLLYDKEGTFYVFYRKIKGKSVFLCDNGVYRLYVLGSDEHFYSIKAYNLFALTFDVLEHLVDAALGIFSKYPDFYSKLGIYRNMRQNDYS